MRENFPKVSKTPASISLIQTKPQHPRLQPLHCPIAISRPVSSYPIEGEGIPIWLLQVQLGSTENELS